MKKTRNHKVLYYESSSGFGGSSSNLCHILRQLDKSKFDPIVIVHNDGSQFDRMSKLGFRVVKIPFDNLEEINQAGSLKLLYLFFQSILPMAWKFRNIIKKEAIDIIHINTNILLGIPMILAGKFTGKKVFCYIRETRKLIGREKLFVSMINQFFILNNEARHLYSQDIPKEKLSVIYDGVDLEEFTQVDASHFKEEFNLNSSPVVGLIGRVIRGKGQGEFVLVAKEVVKEFPNARFVVVGDAKGENIEYFNEVKALVSKEQLEEKVIFTGWRTDVKDIMSGLDVLVLASTTFPEGLPNAIIEAMALAKPAVATDIPGPPEIIDNGRTGFIVPPGDTKAMAEKLIYLLKNPEHAHEMGINGRKRVEDLFDVRKVVKQTEALYQKELLAGLS